MRCPLCGVWVEDEDCLERHLLAEHREDLLEDLMRLEVKKGL